MIYFREVVLSILSIISLNSNVLTGSIENAVCKGWFIELYSHKFFDRHHESDFCPEPTMFPINQIDYAEFKYIKTPDESIYETIVNCDCDELCSAENECSKKNLLDSGSKNDDCIKNDGKRLPQFPLKNFRSDAHGQCDPESLNDVPDNTDFCPGNRIPVGHERVCFGAIPGEDESGQCIHPAGTCFKGYCCPILNLIEGDLPDLPYITRAECDPKCPLSPEWLFAFCDPQIFRVVFIGRKLLYSNELYRDSMSVESKECETNAVCEDKSVCVRTVINNFSTTQEEWLVPSGECWPNPLRPTTPAKLIRPWYVMVLLWSFFGIAFVAFSLLLSKENKE